MEKVIDTKNLSFGYNESLILQSVNFSVDRGDFIGIVGPNGSGKSTLIKLLLRIVPPLSGQMEILGQNIDRFDSWYKIGYIYQKANSFNSSFPATVEEVVGANLFSKVGLFKRLNRQHRDRIEHALDIVGLSDYKNRLIGNLSGGQQQRVFIARVLVNDPEIMFLDEPTVGVDAKSEDAVYCLLARLNKELGITIVMVTHDISAITAHANKLACVSNKSILVHDPQEGMTQELMSRMYGYEVKLHIHKHDCVNCSRREVV